MQRSRQSYTHTMRRTGFKAVAVLLLCGGAVSAAAAATFSDVPSNAPYAGAVETLVQLRVLSPYREGNAMDTGMFRPNDPATLAEVLRMAALAAKLPFGAARVPSNLSAQGTWVAPYVNAFAPLHPLLLRDNKLNVFGAAERGQAASLFLDAFRVSYTDPAIAAARLGVSGLDQPRTIITRAQAAVMLSHFLSLVPNVPASSAVSSLPPIVSSAESSSASSVQEVIPASAPPVMQVPPGSVIGTFTQAINVRKKPDMSSSPIDSFPGGTQVIILDQSDPVWLQVRMLDGREGYVGRKFVNIGG